MTDALRRRLGWWAARRVVASRSPRRPAAAVSVRRVLVVLPPGVAALRSAWTLVEAIAAPVVPIVSGDAVAFVPDAFAGAVVRIGRDGLNGLGVPGRTVRDRLWTSDLDVAVTLAPPDDLVAAVLVGGAPVGLRIGLDAPDTVGFYDLALGAGTTDPAGCLLVRLGQIRPALVPLYSADAPTAERA